MKLTTSSIYLQGIRFFARHGVLEQERLTGGQFVVDVRVEYNIGQAMLSDDVDDTLNYARLYETIREQMMIPSKLLEHVAGRIGEAIFTQFPETTAVDIRLTKKNPPMAADLEGAGVELHLINDKTIC